MPHSIQWAERLFRTAGGTRVSRANQNYRALTFEVRAPSDSPTATRIRFLPVSIVK
jgi:hypothetical protein